MGEQRLQKQIEKEVCKEFCYTDKQMKKVMDFIEKKFGSGKKNKEGLISHEITSEYIHTDVVVTGNNEYQHFVSCGMGAREMCNWAVMGQEELKRIEVMLAVSPDYELDYEEKGFLCSELTRVTKFPFRENTFFGPGHTINASKRFKEKYGYDYFLFFLPIEQVKVGGIGTIYFLPLIPIYEEERDWMVENNSFQWLYAMQDIGEAVYINKKRKVFIPNK